MNTAGKSLDCIICGNNNNSRLLYKNSIRQESNVSLTERFKCTNTATFSSTGQVVKCRKCGLVYVDNRPDSDEAIQSAYEAVEDELYLKNTKAKIITFNKVMTWLENHIPTGKLLDVGCYYGLLLHTAKQRGWDVKGVELSRQAVEYAKKNFGVEIFNGLLDQAHYQDDQFDLVTMMAVIEHLSDPRKELSEIRRILKKDGIVAIATHNIESLLAKMMGKHYPWLCQMHLYHFSPRTMEKLLSINGFKVIKHYSYGQIYNLGYVADRIGTKSIISKIIRPVLKMPRIAALNVPIDTHDAFLTIAKKI